jgi:DHA1 family bicyclomycin/chloramphenicol resistance-like MFS transporter
MGKRPALLGFVARISLLTSIAALSIDTMLPALPAIGESLQVDNSNDLQLVITLFVFGMFLGELIFGPLSDSLGRKKALAIGLVIYCAGTAIALGSTTLHQLLLGRIIQGIGVSGPKIISRAMIRDQFEGNRMARIFSFVMTVFIFAPMIAPALGQGIVLLAGWRAIFFFFLILAVFTAALIMIQQPETLAPERRRPINLRNLLSKAGLILRTPRVTCYAVTAGLVFGILLLFLSTSQAMFHYMYDREESFPLYYAILSSGFGVAALLNARLVMKHGMYRLCLGGLIGLIGLGIFFLFAGEGGVPSFGAFMAGCYVLMLCAGILFSNLSALAMQPLGKMAGLGASLVSAISSIIAVTVSLFAGRFYDNTLYPFALVIIICGIISLWLFFIVPRTPSDTITQLV